MSLTAKSHAARLVAVRASQQKTEKRRHQRNSEAKLNGRKVAKKALIRDGWHLMVTHVSGELQAHGSLRLMRMER